ncbi:M10 family metallopeptidase [Pseudomonas sp. C11]|uniref:M10 family metallopeptidase n=1 Tax=Pseudomonas sp. C11 TaxID=3075550 RepID=UPI002AFF020E|nr:M10 family metallopeptidase [Pseudomonas sp. C11]
MPTYQQITPYSNVSLSVSTTVNALLYGTKWSGTAPLSYSFANPDVSLYSSSYDFYDLPGISSRTYVYALTANQQDAVRSALADWSSVANLSFTEVSDTAGGQVGDLRFGGYALTDSDTAAFAFLPGGSPIAGDVWVGFATNESAPSPGSYDYLTFVHEIGHALGLKHSFEASESSNYVLRGRYDDVRYTVMSYNDSYDFQPTGPMLFDIAAIQYLYGSNDSWQTGDNVYRWDANAQIFETIWDAGGNDTIDASNQLKGVEINLNSGEFSSIGQNIYNYSTGASRNDFLTIAYGAVIENAIGSDYNDTLIGNSADNVLDGGKGRDTLRGGAGNDTYYIDLPTGSDFYDRVTEYAGEGYDKVILRGSSAGFFGSTFSLDIDVEAVDASQTSNVALTLLGNNSDNRIVGNAANNVLDGGAGADTLIGGAGNDTYVVDNVGDVVVELADEGTDLVRVAIATAGGTYTLGEHVENATLTNTVAFNLTGNSLANILIGNAANNVLDGGAGADTMNGGAGDDTYIVDDSGDVIIDSAGVDSVRASASYVLGSGLENLVLTGNQAISGTGNALANVLDGSQNSAANELRGLGGNDTYIVGAGDTVIEQANGGIDLVQAYVSFTLGDNLENLTLLGSDALSGTGNGLANVIIGNDGNNVLDGAAGVDTLRGGKGDDTYFVDLTTDNLLEDQILENAGEGMDTLMLRGGNTDLASPAMITLMANMEALDASATGQLRINLSGNALNNRLVGNAADNLLDGGVGADTMIGGNGNDTYMVDNVGDVVTEQADQGIDLVQVAIATAGGTYTLGEHVENATLTNTVAFNLTGNSLANTLIGNAANNVLDGGAGADIMNGGAGNDTYIVDDSDDVIIDSAGVDSVLASASYTLSDNLENLTLQGTAHIDGTGNGLVNTITGNDGNNTLDGGAGVDTLRGGKGDDTYIVDLTTKNALEDKLFENLNEGSDTVQLRGGNAALSTVATIALANNFENLDASDTGSTRLNLTGNALDNVITGNAANNVLNGGAGADILIGGDGNDTYVVDNFGDVVTEQADQGIDLVQVAIATAGGTYTLGEHVENATLTNKVAFNLTGNDLNNTLIGNAANNVLDGGLGADTMNGGAGNDTYIVDDSGDVIIDSAGIDTVRASIAYTLGNGLENLVLTGDQAIAGTGNTLANVLDGSQNSAANILSGLAGNDTYIVGAGDSVIENDAKGGIDLVKSYVDFELGLNLENLTLLGSDDLSGTGNGLANVITGNDGNNTLDGGAGVDTLRGGKGDDTYVVDLTMKNALEDKLFENLNEGSDTVQLRGGNAALTTVATIALANNVENLDASDTSTTRLNLTGNALDNVLTGNAANNVLNGGAGADTLIGGDGNDTYVVDNLGDVVTEQADQGIDLVQVAIATAGGTYTLGEHVENATLTSKVAFNLTGNDLANTLIGNAANNVLDGGLGADTMNGGAGNDTYIVDDVGDVIIDSAGLDTVRASIAYTLGNGLENLELTGNQAISGTGNGLANVLDGSQNAAANELRGLGGNDTYIVGAGDTVIEQANGGIDLVKAYVSYVLGDNLENLSLLGSANLDATGNALANTLTGNDGNNTLDGGAGVDTLRGGKGDDTYWVDLTASNALQDRIVENANEGIDTLILRGGVQLPKASTITLATHLENLDASETGNIALNLTGNAGNNLLTGNQGNNTLSGGDGSDILVGMGGFDTLTGGRGADTFRFDLSWLGLNDGADALITDFRRLDGDKIQLQGDGAQDFSFVGQSFDAESASSHQLRFEAGTLYGSVDAGASNAFEIRLLGVNELRQDDFLFG